MRKPLSPRIFCNPNVRRLLLGIVGVLLLSLACALPGLGLSSSDSSNADLEATMAAAFTAGAGMTIQNGDTPQSFGTVPAEKSTRTPANSERSGLIVFTCFVEGFDQICLMPASGGEPVQLTDTRATNFYASVAPDGQSIYFSSRRDFRFEIYTMDLDGTDQRRLTQAIGSGLYAPELSPNDQQIVFTNDKDGVQSIWVMNRDGSDPHPLTDRHGSDIDPIWSSDGTQIAFSSNRGGSRQIHIMNSDGGNLQKLTDRASMGGRISWSPDGRSIAFYAGPQLEREVYILNLDSGQVSQLTQGGDNLAPHFSPDGQWIVFTSHRDGDNEIFAIRTDGTDLTQLTFNERSDWQPRWGP